MKPNKVRILGKTIPILYVYNYIAEENLCGTFHPFPLEIKIDADLEGQALEDTILHESLHAALYITGYSAKLCDDEEESLVLGLEHALSTVVKIRRR